MAGARVAIVTGASSGIGEACARRFAAAGDFVVVADVGEAQGRAVASGIGRGEFRRLDVADEAAVEAVVAEVVRAYGAPGVLVNCAGILEMPAAIGDYPLDQHDRLWSVNYRGTYLMCRAAGPAMAAAGRGAIVNVSSVVGAFRAAPLLAYAPSKAAVKALTESLACEFGPAGVRVNAVAPGATLTPPNRKRFESGQRERAPDQASRQPRRSNSARARRFAASVCRWARTAPRPARLLSSACNRAPPAPFPSQAGSTQTSAT